VIVASPPAAAIPVTVPAPSTEATVGAPLLHVPPNAVSVRCVVCPAHTAKLPVIVVSGLTITGITTEQAPTPYDMIVVPEATPVTVATVPVDGPTVATVGRLLVHDPPGVRSASDIVLPTQTLSGPTIGDGIGITLTEEVAEQPVLERV